MKSATPAMVTHLAGEVTTLAACWRIVRRDGTELGFTSHDQDFIYNGLLYESAKGFSRTAIETSSGITVDNLDVDGILDSEKITVEDIRNRLYDQASVYVFLVNYNDLSPTMGDIKLRRGWFGEAALKSNGMYSIELRGMMQALMQEAIEAYTPECRADFGDARCMKDLGPLTQSGIVKSVSSKTVFQVSGLTEPPNGFVGGTIQITSGQNNGGAMEVTSYALAGDLVDPTLATVEIFDNFHFPLNVDDTFIYWPGCPKTVTACKAYGNYINYQGEPDVPGQDEMLDYPNAH